MPRAHNTVATFAALLLAAAAGGGAACICIGAGRHVARQDRIARFRTAMLEGPPVSHRWQSERGASASDAVVKNEHRGPNRDGARVEDALHDRVDIAVGADRLALVLCKKKVKKKVKAFRRVVTPLPARATCIPMIDVDPQKVSPQTHPAIPLLRTVVLLA